MYYFRFSNIHPLTTTSLNFLIGHTNSKHFDMGLAKMAPKSNTFSCVFVVVERVEHRDTIVPQLAYITISKKS